MNKYDLEDFKKIWKETSKERILNQFYYEHIELVQLQSNWNSLREWLKEMKLSRRYDNDVERFTAYGAVLDKMNELEGGDSNDSKRDV